MGMVGMRSREKQEQNDTDLLRFETSSPRSSTKFEGEAGVPTPDAHQRIAGIWELRALALLFFFRFHSSFGCSLALSC